MGPLARHPRSQGHRHAKVNGVSDSTTSGEFASGGKRAITADTALRFPDRQRKFSMVAVRQRREALTLTTVGLEPWSFRIAGVEMKCFFNDRTALVVALVGTCLAVLTLVWRINPVEGSVMPRFITQAPLGWLVYAILLVSSVPTWFAVLPLALLLPTSFLPYPYVLLQALVFFLTAKLIRLGKQRLSRRRRSSKSQDAIPGT